VYTEDNLQTAFNVKVVIGERGNSTDPFSTGSTTKSGYGTSQSREGDDYEQITEVGVTPRHRLAVCPSPMTIFANSSVDPFFKPPFRLSAQDLEAVDHSKCHVKNL
jgi:hypothetical protein